MFFSELKKKKNKKKRYIYKIELITLLFFSSRCWNQVLFCMPIKTRGSTPHIYIPYFHCPLTAVYGTIFFFQSAPLVGILVISRPWITADVEAKTRSQSTVQVSRVGRAKWQAQNAEPVCLPLSTRVDTWGHCPVTLTLGPASIVNIAPSKSKADDHISALIS